MKEMQNLENQDLRPGDAPPDDHSGRAWRSCRAGARRPRRLRPLGLPPVPPRPSEGPSEVALSRVTYKLPAGHAEATAAFLRDHVGASVLETQADGDNLIVTTTPETQKVIRLLVGLVQSKPAMPATTPLPAATDGPGGAPIIVTGPGAISLPPSPQGGPGAGPPPAVDPLSPVPPPTPSVTPPAPPAPAATPPVVPPTPSVAPPEAPTAPSVTPPAAPSPEKR